jgi:hypothetical protein
VPILAEMKDDVLILGRSLICRRIRLWRSQHATTCDSMRQRSGDLLALVPVLEWPAAASGTRLPAYP